MKRQWIIAGVVSLLLIVGGFVVAQCLWWLPLDKCSEVYRRYADNPDINAAYVKDFKVNDTVSVNVTTLEAKSDTGWAVLLKELNIATPPKEVMEMLGENAIHVKSAPKSDYTKPKDPDLIKNDIIAICFGERTICIFHVASVNQINAIRHNQYDESIKNSSK